MRIELPLFVQTGTPNVPKGTTLLRPLFFEQPAETDREIARARAGPGEGTAEAGRPRTATLAGLS